MSLLKVGTLIAGRGTDEPIITNPRQNADNDRIRRVLFTVCLLSSDRSPPCRVPVGSPETERNAIRESIHWMRPFYGAWYRKSIKIPQMEVETFRYQRRRRVRAGKTALRRRQEAAPGLELVNIRGSQSPELSASSQGLRFAVRPKANHRSKGAGKRTIVSGKPGATPIWLNIANCSSRGLPDEGNSAQRCIQQSECAIPEHVRVSKMKKSQVPGAQGFVGGLLHGWL